MPRRAMYASHGTPCKTNRLSIANCWTVAISVTLSSVIQARADRLPVDAIHQQTPHILHYILKNRRTSGFPA